MNTCIYFVENTNGLTYHRKEHVIPAGIGGRCTLPKGYVSDQANELFSKRELACLRYSPLQITRARYGPGKRGSNNVSSIDVPDVFSLRPLTGSSSQYYACPLGFLFQGKAYILPQIIAFFDVEENFSIVQIRSTYQTPGNLKEKAFLFQLEEFLMSKEKIYKSIEVPHDTKEHFVCIGCYKKTWYVCSTKLDFDIDKWASLFLANESLSKTTTIPFSCLPPKCQKK